MEEALSFGKGSAGASSGNGAGCVSGVVVGSVGGGGASRCTGVSAVGGAGVSGGPGGKSSGEIDCAAGTVGVGG